MEVGARRWILRHESRYYGMQQARNLYNAFTCDKGIRSAPAMLELLPTVNRSENKGWVIRVPAAAVIPEARVMAPIIWSKAPVAGSISSW
jgi:hypothetical protein